MTAFLLDVSQTDLPDGIGSNAYTVRSVYTALKFLRNETEFDGAAINESTITHYAEFMIEGNTVYDIITRYALFLKSDWLVALLFLLKLPAKKRNSGQKSEIAGKNLKWQFDWLLH